jgi:hypothetical protein
MMGAATVALMLVNGSMAREKNTEQMADDAAVPVNITNAVRAETDTMIRVQIESFDLQFGKLMHLRDPMTAENQSVIRVNQDTLYSSTVLDLAEPVSATLPDAGGRFQSMLVISQDHYNFGEAKPGTYLLTEEEVGTRFAYLLFRTFIDVMDPEDIAAAHAAQDGIRVSGGGQGPFEAPNWSLKDLKKARSAVNALSELGYDTRVAFGRKSEVEPLQHLLGALGGWGGQPPSMAIYESRVVEKNDGDTPYVLTVKDVPVDAFWSVTVYNSEGFLEANDTGRSNYNNFSAEPNADGSFTIHFGGDPTKINYLPVPDNWTWVVRLYQPQEEIIDGSWTFPDPVPLP